MFLYKVIESRSRSQEQNSKQHCMSTCAQLKCVALDVVLAQPASLCANFTFSSLQTDSMHQFLTSNLQ